MYEYIVFGASQLPQLLPELLCHIPDKFMSSLSLNSAI